MAPPTLARVVSKSFPLIALLACMQVACAAADSTQVPGTYSSLTYNEEGGDLLGYEVRMIPTNQGIRAVVQVAEGDAGRIHIVDVVEAAGEVSFEIPLASGMHGNFNGKVTSNGLEGEITYPSGEHESLLLKRAISYWER